MASPMDRTAPHLRKLAVLVMQRRVALGITDKRVAAKRCVLSVTTYSKVEKGEPVTDTSYAKLEAGFGLLSGSCRAVLEGADSITLQDGRQLIDSAQIVRFDPGKLKAELRQAVTRSAGVVAPDLTLGQVDAMYEGLIKQLQEQGVFPNDE
ncbi:MULTISPECIES: hypothetical protein [Streptomyces]|uniref:DNA-binding protein n=1 Tax=Streptomyces stelliscabiei TaxID=146820 RepID=A0A8I0P4X5_9ACTN|nr:MULTISPECIES: hypothetical protein [Streptomyces]MBE1599756.1 hypothetical protein [Streptomyces stelliscabiei]MDX2519413.1 hypothetical protein [Streptomyces stelliscabiei]MDX2549658.1 hypothetical protein [Streptomyces stelliscabiei]MDX2616088.1 hypothetical protein [Streptomyces stelliscabiei]MDX2634224.1 hypothetical protein [Streptomyces stelliscabiei]